MTGLNQRGDISIALIVVYSLVIGSAIVLSFRHGFGRQAGWVFLVIFCIIRILGGALEIAVQKSSNPSVGLISAAIALETAGLSPLLLCTTGFLGFVGMKNQGEGEFRFASPHFLRLLRLAIIISFILSIIGGTDATSTNSSTRSTGTTLRKAGAIVFVVCYAIIAGILFLFWENAKQILPHRKTLLHGISCALPFLAVRVIYSVLSAFSPAPTFGPNGEIAVSNSSLSKFNSITGKWQIYLGMALIMEFIVVGIYVGFGFALPDKLAAAESEKDGDAYALEGNRNQA